MPSETVNGTTYSLVYRHSMDDKRRVPVPFRWRPKEPIDFALVVWPKHAAGTCLRVLPPGPWARFMAEIEAMEDVERKPTVKRMIGTFSTTMKLDAAGRLTIPENMAAAADIKPQGEVVLVGLLDRFEIWSPARYTSAHEMDSPIWKQVLTKMGE
jgi:MraZ protein